ncbi:MAG TPA: GIY-YIG nuclease family protein [Candidatus Andersenbacteria bacterium]|nr:GIY-YIG nuclease family protein [Candidatus Andersenbacteria bacterium]
MYFVYILESQKDGSYYKGVTVDLKKRLEEHNSVKNRYTSNKQPFQIVWYCRFKDKKKAYDFEKYLKSGSGFAFAKKRLI